MLGLVLLQTRCPMLILHPLGETVEQMIPTMLMLAVGWASNRPTKWQDFSPMPEHQLEDLVPIDVQMAARLPCAILVLEVAAPDLPLASRPAVHTLMHCCKKPRPVLA